MKAVTVLVGATGIGSAVGTALWNKGIVNTVSDEKLNLTHSTSPESISRSAEQEQVARESRIQAPVATKEGNCKVVNTSKIDIFFDLSIEENDYLVIYCTDANAEESEVQMKSNWTGLFPEAFFQNHFSLSEGTTFNLKMRTELIDEAKGIFKSSFSSNKFWDSPIEGVWENTPLEFSGKSVTTVEVTSGEHRQYGNIYLLLGQEV